MQLSIYSSIFLGSFSDLFDLFVATSAHTTIFGIRRTASSGEQTNISIACSYIIYYTFAISLLPFQSITIDDDVALLLFLHNPQHQHTMFLFFSFFFLLFLLFVFFLAIRILRMPHALTYDM